jgi:hypothetical protein
MRIISIGLMVAASLAVYAAPASAAPSCSPSSNSARILTKPSPNALHPDWQGDNFVGTGWSLTPKKIISNVTGRYALGDLHGSRSGVVNRNIYVVLSEWDCAGIPGGASAPASAGATADAANFDGAWERLGTQCEASHTRANGDYFTILASTYAAGCGVTCANISLKRLAENGLEVAANCGPAGGGPLQPVQHRYRLRGGLIEETAGAAVTARYEKCEALAPGDTEAALPCQDGAYGLAEISGALYQPVLKIRHDANAIQAAAGHASWYAVKCDAAGRVSRIEKFVFGKLTSATVPDYVDSTSFVKSMTISSPDGTLLTTAFITRDGGNRPVKVESKGADGQSKNAATIAYDGSRQIVQVVDGSSGQLTSRWERWFYPDGPARIWKVFYPAYWYEYQYGSPAGNMLVRYKGDKNGAFWKTTFQYDAWQNVVSESSIALNDTSDTLSKTGAYGDGDLVQEAAILKNGDKLEWQTLYDERHSYTESRLTANGRYVVRFVVTRNGSALEGTTAYAPDGRLLVTYPGVSMRYIHRDGSPVDGGAFKKSASGMLW